jgi:hypothetical protein
MASWFWPVKIKWSLYLTYFCDSGQKFTVLKEILAVLAVD